MTKQELRSDLQDIRYYYIHKAMFDKAENLCRRFFLCSTKSE